MTSDLSDEVIERLGVDDPKAAHGGRPRRNPAPPFHGGLVTRVRPPTELSTRLRRLPPQQP
jgi:hypothetical protein